MLSLNRNQSQVWQLTAFIKLQLEQYRNTSKSRQQICELIIEKLKIITEQNPSILHQLADKLMPNQSIAQFFENQMNLVQQQIHHSLRTAISRMIVDEMEKIFPNQNYIHSQIGGNFLNTIGTSQSAFSLYLPPQPIKIQRELTTQFCVQTAPVYNSQFEDSYELFEVINLQQQPPMQPNEDLFIFNVQNMMQDVIIQNSISKRKISIDKNKRYKKCGKQKYRINQNKYQSQNQKDQIFSDRRQNSSELENSEKQRKTCLQDSTPKPSSCSEYQFYPFQNQSQYSLEETQKYGHFLYCDKIEKIIQIIQHEGSLFAQIIWKKRKNGTRPLQTILHCSVLMNHCPQKLIQFYEELL